MVKTREEDRALLVGINHVALEVGDIEQALDFYGKLFEFTLRSQGETMAVIDLGDQFLALSKRQGGGRDEARHFGLVVDDQDKARAAIEAAGVEILPGRRLDILDPWGNRVEIIDYRSIQFTKTAGALHHLGRPGLGKTEAARADIAKKGLAGGE